MKIRKLLYFPLLGLLALTSLFSCGEDRWKEYYPLTGRDLWMDSLMREVYLWYEDIPAANSLNYFQAPDAFLKSILSKNDKGFSTVDSIMDTPLPSYGFDYTLYKVATSDTTYTALVSYVAKNSPAEDAGLERGNWIMLVDGDSITKKTEERLIDGGARTLRIGKYVIVKEENNGGTEGDTENGENEEEDKEVGIIQETGDVALPAVSQECKQRGINNLVLDFRYNSGGEMECVQLLADILVPADKLESPFAFLQYNDKQSAQNRDLILDSQLLQGGVNLNLPTVYIITSGTTAGAAEMLINCLKPYMKVVLIGQTTKGEYVATETFINPKYPWAVRPVVCEVFNSNGEADYSAGFKPDIAINETSYLQYYLPLGEPDEILLHTALQVIAGIVELPTPKTGTAIVRSFTTQKNLRKGLIVK